MRDAVSRPIQKDLQMSTRISTPYGELKERRDLTAHMDKQGHSRPGTQRAAFALICPADTASRGRWCGLWYGTVGWPFGQLLMKRTTAANAEAARRPARRESLAPPRLCAAQTGYGGRGRPRSEVRACLSSAPTAGSS